MRRAVVRCEFAEQEAWADGAEIYDNHQRAAKLACQGFTIPVYESTVLPMRTTFVAQVPAVRTVRFSISRGSRCNRYGRTNTFHRESLGSESLLETL